MPTILLIGRQGLLRSLLKEHLENSAAGECVVEADEERVFGDELGPVSTIVLLLQDHAGAADSLIERLRQSHPGVPICAVSDKEDRATVLHLLKLGVQGLVSMRTDASSLGPILGLLAVGEVFVPLSVAAAVNEPVDACSPQSVPRGDTDIRLTAREQQVAAVLFRGQSNKQIARELAMTENTVKIHVRNVMRKLGARNRSEAIVIAQTRSQHSHSSSSLPVQDVALG